MVSIHRRWSSTLVTPLTAGDASIDQLLLSTNGIGIVNSNTGTLLGFITLGENLGEDSTLLGWKDGLPVLGLVRTDTNARPPKERRRMLLGHQRPDLPPEPGGPAGCEAMVLRISPGCLPAEVLGRFCLRSSAGTRLGTLEQIEVSEESNGPAGRVDAAVDHVGAGAHAAVERDADDLVVGHQRMDHLFLHR